MIVKTRFNVGETAYIPIVDKSKINKSPIRSYVVDKIIIRQIDINIIGLGENEVHVAIFYFPFENPTLYNIQRKIESDEIYATEEECQIYCDKINKEIIVIHKTSSIPNKIKFR